MEEDEARNLLFYS